MTEELKVTMPESLMHVIKLACASDMNNTEKLEAVTLICHGHSLWKQQSEKFDGKSYALPDRQWTQIAEWLQGTGRTVLDGAVPQPLTRAENDAIGKDNPTLDFMKSGPSSYKETTT